MNSQVVRGKEGCLQGVRENNLFIYVRRSLTQTFPDLCPTVSDGVWQGSERNKCFQVFTRQLSSYSLPVKELPSVTLTLVERATCKYVWNGRHRIISRPKLTRTSKPPFGATA